MPSSVPSDIEISRAATPKAITEVAAAAGILPEELEPYGSVKAKVKLSIMDSDGTNVASQSVTPTTSWAEYGVSAPDMSGWTGPLRMVLTAEGVCGSAAALSELDVEYLRITQWTA